LFLLHPRAQLALNTGRGLRVLPADERAELLATERHSTSSNVIGVWRAVIARQEAISSNIKVAETIWNMLAAVREMASTGCFHCPRYQDRANGPISFSTRAVGACPMLPPMLIQQVIGGTNTAAPLRVGLVALINEVRGSSIGQPRAALYANPSAFA
jgi:hypothetical protein